VQLRLTLYKQLSDTHCRHELQDIRNELIDRFGKLPDSANNLYQLHLLRLKAEKCGISKIEASKQFIYFYFEKESLINRQKLIALLQRVNTAFTLQGANKLRKRLSKNEKDRDEEISIYTDAIDETLDMLTDK
jgi:transcription-repair coupling factor (superfamily II helicase)